MLLCDVPLGCRASITNYGGREQRHKLLSMGLVPGRPFVLRNPDHSGSRVLDCSGCTIAITGALAQSIQVKVLN